MDAMELKDDFDAGRWGPSGQRTYRTDSLSEFTLWFAHIRGQNFSVNYSDHTPALSKFAQRFPQALKFPTLEMASQFAFEATNPPPPSSISQPGVRGVAIVPLHVHWAPR